MVHALKEAHRILKPEGILIDLRPGPAHRRLGIGEGRGWRPVGRLHEILDDDYAANAAVARVLREGFFRRKSRQVFLLDRVMDRVEEVRDWIADFDQRRNLPSHTAVLRRLQLRLQHSKRPAKISVRGPMQLAVLSRLDPPSDK